MKPYEAAIAGAALLVGIFLWMNPAKPAPTIGGDTIQLDLAQWQCTQAATVYELERGDLVPKGRCTNYSMIIQEAAE